MLLRYTGSAPVTFTSIGVEAFPGDEFEVPDEVAAAFTTRADVEAAPAARPAKVRRAAKADDEPAPPADPAGDSTTPAGPAPDPTAAL